MLLRRDPARAGAGKWGLYKSTNGGASWSFIHDGSTNVADCVGDLTEWNNGRTCSPRGVRSLALDPTNPEIVYTTGASAYKSLDGGRTFNVMGGQSHSDHHALWINPRNNQHLVIGNDGGLDVSYDQGATWEEISLSALGQFYAISVDMRKPYYVCGGLQDNGSWCGPSAVRSASGAVNTDWFNVGGGDGFYTRQDPSDYTIVYAESQNGAMSRLDLRNGTNRSVRPNAGPAGGRGGGGGSGGGGRGGAANILNVPAQPTPFLPRARCGVAPARSDTCPAG